MHRLPAVLIPLLVAVAMACDPSGSNATDPDGTQQRRPEATASAPARDTAARSCRRPCRRRPAVVGSFGRSNAPEASGLAASRRTPGLLYVLDDGPGTTSLLVVRARNGRTVGRVAVQGLNSTDSEDLAVGPCRRGEPASCVYIGDIGDNVRGRDTITLLRITEPPLRDGLPAAAVPSDVVRLRYPDGAHDAETLLVDADASIGIVTKVAGRGGRGAARLYTASRFAEQTLRDEGRIRVPAASLPLASAVVGNVVTAGDATRDAIVLRTYDALYEYPRRAGAPLRALTRAAATEIPSPSEPQGEAVAYGVDGCTLYTVSEDSGKVTVIACRSPRKR